MYFCGYTIENILEQNLPQKAANCGIDLSFELAIISMLELKNNESAALVHGSTNHGSGQPRAWVEYRDENGNRKVQDYCSEWREIAFNVFQNRFFPDTERLYLHYIFWTRYTGRLYELVQRPETSFVFAEVNHFRPTFRNGKLFGILDFMRHDTESIVGTEFKPVVVKSPDDSETIMDRDFFNFLMS